MRRLLILLFALLFLNSTPKAQSAQDIDLINYLFAEYGYGVGSKNSYSLTNPFINNGRLLSEPGYTELMMELKDITSIEAVPEISDDEFIYNYNTASKNINRIVVRGKVYNAELSNETPDLVTTEHIYSKGSLTDHIGMEIKMEFHDNFEDVKLAAELLKKICGFKYGALPKLTKSALGGIADMKPFRFENLVGSWDPTLLNYGGLALIELQKDSLSAFITKTGNKADEKTVNGLFSLKNYQYTYNSNNTYIFRENGKISEEGKYTVDFQKRKIINTPNDGTAVNELWLKSGNLQLKLSDVLFLVFEKR